MASDLSRKSFGLLIPVGPSGEDLSRLNDLLESVAYYEPVIPHCVLIDDAPQSRDLRQAVASVDGRELIVLPNPRDKSSRASQGGRTPGLAAGILTGLAWLHSNAPVDVVLKLDLDALVINRFCEQVASFFRAHPEAGLVGCIGETCDRRNERHLRCLRRPSFFKQALAIANASRQEFRGDQRELSIATDMGRFQVTAEQVEAFEQVCPEILQAISNGLSTHRYCQGGAWAMSSAMLHRLAISGYLRDPVRWAALPFFGEDITISMYAYAVGLEVCDYSDVGEPFGLCYRGLPFAPAGLIASGYSITHSLKNDPQYTEAEIRAFFAEKRRDVRRISR